MVQIAIITCDRVRAHVELVIPLMCSCTALLMVGVSSSPKTWVTVAFLTPSLPSDHEERRDHQHGKDLGSPVWEEVCR